MAKKIFSSQRGLYAISFSSIALTTFFSLLLILSINVTTHDEVVSTLYVTSGEGKIKGGIDGVFPSSRVPELFSLRDLRVDLEQVLSNISGDLEGVDFIPNLAIQLPSADALLGYGSTVPVTASIYFLEDQDFADLLAESDPYPHSGRTSLFSSEFNQTLDLVGSLEGLLINESSLRISPVENGTASYFIPASSTTFSSLNLFDANILASKITEIYGLRFTSTYTIILPYTAITKFGILSFPSQLDFQLNIHVSLEAYQVETVLQENTKLNRVLQGSVNDIVRYTKENGFLPVNMRYENSLEKKLDDLIHQMGPHVMLIWTVIMVMAIVLFEINRLRGHWSKKRLSQFIHALEVTKESQDFMKKHLTLIFSSMFAGLTVALLGYIAASWLVAGRFVNLGINLISTKSMFLLLALTLYSEILNALDVVRRGGQTSKRGLVGKVIVGISLSGAMVFSGELVLTSFSRILEFYPLFVIALLAATKLITEGLMILFEKTHTFFMERGATDLPKKIYFRRTLSSHLNSANFITFSFLLLLVTPMFYSYQIQIMRYDDVMSLPGGSSLTLQVSGANIDAIMGQVESSMGREDLSYSYITKATFPVSVYSFNQISIYSFSRNFGAYSSELDLPRTVDLSKLDHLEGETSFYLIREEGSLVPGETVVFTLSGTFFELKYLGEAGLLPYLPTADDNGWVVGLDVFQQMVNVSNPVVQITYFIQEGEFPDTLGGLGEVVEASGSPAGGWIYVAISMLFSAILLALSVTLYLRYLQNAFVQVGSSLEFFGFARSELRRRVFKITVARATMLAGGTSGLAFGLHFLLASSVLPGIRDYGLTATVALSPLVTFVVALVVNFIGFLRWKHD